LPVAGPARMFGLFVMTVNEHITYSAEETMALGRKLAPTLKNARMVILRGDLGTGKTTLVKGIAEGLEAASHEDVTSPTFTLIHEYRGPEVNLYHVDLYRIDTPRELDTLGLDELFAEEGNLVLLEWGEKFQRFEKERDVEISIQRRGDQERKFTVKRK
jgi:tRNA threonylcarbamoyladenosine biosynthesis protein TsaE